MSVSAPAFVRRPRIQVSSLLVEDSSRSYHLEVVQQPQRTAEFGSASLSRLPITPPVIVKLTVTDRSGNAVIPQHELPFLIAHLSLWTEDGRTRVDTRQGAPLLYGNLVSAVDQLEDMAGNQGLFFCFPDVSVRVRGRYQLGVTLMRISRMGASAALSQGESGHALAETRSRAFDVVERAQYVAVPPTRMTMAFLRQGARMFTYMAQRQ